MPQYERSRFKATDVDAAQTPSKRPHREAFHNSTVMGAELTATEHAHTADRVHVGGVRYGGL